MAIEDFRQRLNRVMAEVADLAKFLDQMEREPVDPAP